jgi:hypothetical protein
MCGSGPKPGEIEVGTSDAILAEQRKKNLSRPTAREATAFEIEAPAAQKARQTLAARLGVQQLRSSFLNTTK